MNSYTIISGDCRTVLNDLDERSVQTCVTSPPYFGLRDYGVDGQIGNESSPEEYVESLVGVFRAVKRVLKDDGTLWLNLGDSYSRGDRGTVVSQKGLCSSKSDKQKYHFESASAKLGKHPIIKPKDLIGIPWRVAFALQEDGWYLRQDIIWHKPNPMPESVKDRCTKTHEYIFLLTKSSDYYYDYKAIRERALTGDEPNERNKRSVWTVRTKPFLDVHFATFPEQLIEPCILAGSARGDIVLDPFTGSGTTGLVAFENGRGFLGAEINPEYKKLAERRISLSQPYLTL